MRRVLLALTLTLLGCTGSPDAPADARPATSADVAVDAPSSSPDAAADGLDAYAGEASTDVPPEPTADIPRPVASNATCATARTITPAASLAAEPLSSGLETPASCSGDMFAPQASLWYRLRVPAGQHLSVSARRPTDSRTAVFFRAFRGCGGACVFGGNILGDGVPSLRWTNTGPDADLVVAIGSGILSEPLPTDVTFTLQASPANAACSGAALLVDGVPAREQDLGFGVDAPPMCPEMSTQTYRAMYYRAAVPAHRVLTVASSAGTRVVLLPACGSTTCLASATPTSGPATTSWSNDGDAAREVIVAVAQDWWAVGLAEVTATVSAPATHGRCATPLRLTDGQWLRGERAGADGEAPRACPSEAPPGPGRFYAVRVGPGEELSVTATSPEGAADGVSLRLLDACAGSACVGAPSAAVYGANWLGYRNDGATAREVVLAAAAAPGHVVTYDLRVRVAPPAYAVTTAAAACDDMRDATAVPLPSGKIFSAPSQPLPFPLRYFGEPVTAWSASNYGYLELWPTSGSTRPSASPAALPSWLPMRVVAPFWNAMNSTSSPFVVARTVESPRRHLAVQWTAAVVASFPTQTLTFQAHLYADDSIEFHYCAVSAGAEASGASASIGLQGDVVPRAAPFAFRRAGAVAAGTAVRFSP